MVGVWVWVSSLCSGAAGLVINAVRLAACNVPESSLPLGAQIGFRALACWIDGYSAYRGGSLRSVLGGFRGVCRVSGGCSFARVAVLVAF